MIETIMFILTKVNAVMCGALALRIIFYDRPPGAEYKWQVSWLAYGIAVFAGFVPIRVFFGKYMSADISEVLLNIAFCIAVFAAHGNVAKVFPIFNKRKPQEKSHG